MRQTIIDPHSFYREVEGNLFDAPEDAVLAHCIDVHAVMGAGVARQFVDRYPEITAIRKNINPLGSCVMIQVEEVIDEDEKDVLIKARWVGNLITKPDVRMNARNSEWPNYDSIRTALTSLKLQMSAYQLGQLAIPQIGCGLDQLDWDMTSRVIKQVFTYSGIGVTVYVYKP